MERIRAFAAGARKQSYERIGGNGETGEDETRPLTLGEDGDGEDDAREGEIREAREEPFEWMVYAVFFLLGVAMLWAWNMFLAAGPYFQKRFRSNDWVLRNFQSAELTVSTIANLGVVLLLTNMQAKASYPKRIIYALLINIVVFTLLAMSTRLFTHVSAAVYFGFLMVLVAAASLATGALQNGIYAYCSGFGKEAYTQGIMTGQAVAGVAPPLVQIISVLSAPPPPPPKAGTDEIPEQSGKSAMAYFLTATGISTLTLLAFVYLYGSRRTATRQKAMLAEASEHDGDDMGATPRKKVPLMTLFRKTFWLATAVFLTFAVTMVYPVFTQTIDSVNLEHSDNPILKPSSFIPLAFFFWNAGDLFGRLITAIPILRITHRPHLIFALSIGRVVWIPLYLLCNVHGNGAKVNSDFFYLVIVQFLFGASNGYVGTNCMMGAAEYVAEEEREAAGGFMGLALVGGLTVGSLMSFLISA